MRRGLVFTALLLGFSACALQAAAGGTSAPHAAAAAYVKACRAALGVLAAGPISKAQVPRVRVRLAAAVAA